MVRGIEILRFIEYCNCLQECFSRYCYVGIREKGRDDWGGGLNGGIKGGICFDGLGNKKYVVFLFLWFCDLVLFVSQI